MLSKLPSFAFVKNLFKFLSLIILFSFFEFPLTADVRRISDRGEIFTLKDKSIRYLAIRSDGRYLFFSEGNSSFNVLDLQDMARLGTETSVDGNVVGLFMDGTSRLVVATTAGVQYFDVTRPLSLQGKEENQKYTQDVSGFTIKYSCFSSDKKVYLLEQGPTVDQSVVRIISGVTADLNPVLWTTIFPNPVNASVMNPIGIKCEQLGPIVIAGNEGDANPELRVGSFSGGNSELLSVFGNKRDYSRTDFFLEENQSRIVFVFNRVSPNGVDPANAKAVPVQGTTIQGNYNLGSDARAGFSFFDAANVLDGFYIGRDSLENPSNPKADRLLSINADALSTLSGTIGDRDTGFSAAGSIHPTVFASSAQDHYKYVATATGLRLVTRAASLVITADSTLPNLKGNTPLNFQLLSDHNLAYEIYFDENASRDGEVTGLASTPSGIQVKPGSLQAGQASAIQLSVSDLHITKDGIHTLMIVGHDSDLNLTLRSGLRFNYDPPPGPVKNLRLNFGDSSTHVFFKSPSGGDIKNFYIYFSYTASDLDDLPLTPDLIPQFTKTFDTEVNSKTLSSPAIVDAKHWDGSYVIHPVKNGKPVYVRVQSSDDGGQMSIDTPAALSQTSYRTLSVEEAVGGSNSCSLGSHEKPENMAILSLIMSFLILVLRRNLGKKIGSSSSRNRRGGD